MTDFEAQVLADLSALKSQMHALLGVGQPGRLQALEDRVERHEAAVQRMKGMGGLLSVALTVVHVAIDFFRRAH
ncbi:MAG: hypothetical protein JSS87_01865 [Acidobacteria bacterium]|nr:hypothetical protein [Acidobacteriota bacterium]